MVITSGFLTGVYIMRVFLVALLFPALSIAQVVNHCVDPKTNKPTFSDVPCEKLGMFTKKTIDGSKMSKADGLPRTNYVDENGNFIANRPVGWYEKSSDDSPSVNVSQNREPEIVIKCRKIHQQALLRGR